MATLNAQVSTGFSDHILAFLEKRFLERLEDELQLVKLGKPKTLPMHMGKTVKWNRFTNISDSTTALSESVSPDGVTLASTAITATLQQYGQYVTVADFFQMTAINDTLLDTNDLLAFAGAKSLDSLARNELDQNGTQNYTGANNSQNDVQSNTTEVVSNDIRKILKNMRKNNVPPFADGNYRGVIHPLMEFDLISESGSNDFVILAANTSNQVQERGEIGVAYSIKLLRSTNIRTDSENDVYGNIFLGRDAFGTVDLQSAGIRIIAKPMGSAGTEDPLDQRATVGYKFVYAAQLLEDVRAQILWAYNAG